MLHSKEDNYLANFTFISDNYLANIKLTECISKLFNKLE